MDEKKKPIGKTAWFMNERVKELECLYKVEGLLNDPDANVAGVCRGIIMAIPPGWQHPDICQVKIVLDDCVNQSPDFKGSPWFMRSEIRVLDKVMGSISVYYLKELPSQDEGPFLKEERKLIDTIAERLGNFLTYQKMKRFYHDSRSGTAETVEERKPEWKILLELLRKTDRILFFHISHKMLNHLCWTGIEEAQKLVQYYDPEQRGEGESLIESNRPYKKKALFTSNDFLSDETFKIAADHLTPDEILSFIQRWIQQDKLNFLLKTLVNLNTPISEVADAVRRFQRMAPEGIDIATTTKNGVLVSLIRRFFSEQLEFINIAKNYIEVGDFFDLLQNVVFFPESNGKLGGKSAGLFLAAQILKRCCKEHKIVTEFKIPKTWYITSDGVLDFVNLNNFEEINEQKYKEIYQVRIEYPNIVQTFKNGTFPPEIVQGLVDGSRRLQGQPSGSAQLEPARGPHGGGFLRKIQEPLFGEPGKQRGSFAGPSRCHCRSLCLCIRAGPDRISRRARPARFPRGDGNHDPRSRRHQGGQVFPARLRRGGFQQKRIPLVAAHQA